MPANLTTWDAMLKTVYPRAVLDLMNNSIKALQFHRQSEKEAWEGKDTMEWPMKVGRTEGYSYGRPGGPIAEAGNQEYTKMKVPLRYAWGRIQFEVPLLKVAQTNRGSFKRVMQAETDGFKDDFIDYENTLIWGYGRGILALVNGAGSGTTTLTVDSPGGYAGSVNGARFLQKNMKIAVVDAATEQITCVRRVTAVAAAGTSVTLNAAVSATDAPNNAYVVKAPNLSITDVNDCAFDREPMGLGGSIDDGTYVTTYHGLNRDLYEITKSPVISVNGALSLDAIQQGCDVAEQLGNGIISKHGMHHSTRRAYLAILTANRRYLSTGGANKHDGGFVGNALQSDAEYAGSPIMVDKDAPYGMWFGFDTRYFLEFTNTPGEWADEDGSILHRLHGTDSFEATWRRFGNYGCEKPAASFRLDGITTSVVVIHVR